MKTKNNSNTGFTIVVLLVGILLLALLVTYIMQKTMKRVDSNIESKNGVEKSVPEPTLQNYQQTLDKAKSDINDSVQKEREKFNEAQKQMDQ